MTLNKNWPDKLIVGLTGNIATGKSAVMAITREFGAETIDADKVTHRVMTEDAGIQRAIVNRFGEEVLLEDGNIDRSALGAIVFNDAAELAALEEIMHPAVRERIVQRIDDTFAPVVLVEAIKLLEGPLLEMSDVLWVTDCSIFRQIQRLIICRGMADAAAVQRVQSQALQADKVAKADVVINTAGTMAETCKQVETAWESLMWLEKPVNAGIAASDALNTDISTSSDAASEPGIGISVTESDLLDEDDEMPFAELIELEALEDLDEEVGFSDDIVIEEEPLPFEIETPSPEDDFESDIILPAEMVAEEIEIELDDDIVVRRAKPADVPALLLLMMRATDGRVQMKRAELLLAMSERSYFIGQSGSDIQAVMGYAVDGGLAFVEQIYVHPAENAGIVGVAVLAELERSAHEHFCEAIVAFPEEGAPREIFKMLRAAGLRRQHPADLPLAWQKPVDTIQQEDMALLAKTLRDVRIG